MKFWIVSCVDASTEKKIEFTIASDESATKKKIKKDLRSAFQEYKSFTLRKGKRPENWSLFTGKR